MDGEALLGMIFRVCKELRVSDIQMRADRPVYIHTNKGMEKLDFLGVLSARQMDSILKALIRNRESGSHGLGDQGSLNERVEDKIARAIHDFATSRASAAFFACSVDCCRRSSASWTFCSAFHSASAST